jgi:sugar lactone lactonase YvrE
VPTTALRRLALLTTTAACALAAFTGAAQAERVELVGGFAGALNGVATGADGNVYLVETYASKVAVVSPAGAILREVPIQATAGTATSAALGPDGRVWVSITSADATRGFARIDAAGVNTPLSTTTLQPCGPAGLAAASATRMIFTLPSDGTCGGGASYLGAVNTDGGMPLATGASGASFDLAVLGGKAYVPSFDGNVVERRGLDGSGNFLPTEATFGIPGASGASGIEAGPGGQLYITMYSSGHVARLDPAQLNGSNATIVASGLTNPFGMANGSDGALYVASQDARLLRIAPDGSQRFIALPAGFHAWQVAARGDDIWVTDLDVARAAVVRNAGRAEPVAPTPTPTPTPIGTPIPIAAPAPTAKPKPLAAAKVLSLAAAKRCASRRTLTLTLKQRASGPKVTSVKVTVGKGKAKTYKSSKLKLPIKLAGLPKGRFTVKVAVAMSDGTTVRLTRTYKTCAKKKKG